MSDYQGGMLDMEKPLPFIQTNPDNNCMEVNTDVIRLLENCKSEISVIAIVGKYRTGKSYIMNRLFNQNAGFELGSAIQAKTKGIWIWAKPHPQNKDITLVLLDIEGLHDIEKEDANNDIKLFSLAILLCNCLVYNFMGHFDSMVVQELHLVTKLTDRIKIKENRKYDEEETMYNVYFPALTFLLRDFFLDLRIDDEPCTTDQYMEHALKCKSGRRTTKEMLEYNEPRQCIRDYFPNRKCVTLCKPVDNDEKLKILDKLDDKDIKEEFRAQAKHAVDVIFEQSSTFMLDGNIMINGQRFLQLAEIYVESINRGDIPCILGAVEMMKQIECTKAIKEAIAVFQETMNQHLKEKMPVEYDHLLYIRHQSREAALKRFDKLAIFDNEGKYLTDLGLEVEKSFEDFKNENDNESVKKCNKQLEECFRTLQEGINDGTYISTAGGHKEFKKAKYMAIEDYKETKDKGPKSEIQLKSYLNRLYDIEQTIIQSDKALGEKEKLLAEKEHECLNQQNKADIAEEENRRVLKELTRQEQDYKKMIEKQEMDFIENQQKLEEQHDRDLKAKEQEMQRMLEEGRKRDAEEMKKIMDDLQDTREQQRQQDLAQMQELKLQHEKTLEEMKTDREMRQSEHKEMLTQMELNYKKQKLDSENYSEQMRRQHQENLAQNERLHQERMAQIRASSTRGGGGGGGRCILQ